MIENQRNRTVPKGRQIDRRATQVTPELIATVTDRIVQNFEPIKVILFGSQAEDRATQSSDIDLLVIIDEAHPYAQFKRRERFGKLLELFRYRSFGLDAIVLTDSEVQTLQDTNEGEWDLILEILAEGKVLYDRGQEAQAEQTCSPTNAGMVL